jgi:hypothetical protein
VACFYKYGDEPASPEATELVTLHIDFSWGGMEWIQLAQDSGR